jgi:hypothetical protein
MPVIAEGATRTARQPANTATSSRPVLLATLSVRIDPAAERVAFDSALDTHAPLIVANMVRLPSYPLTVMLAREYATLPGEEDLDAVRATADRAAAKRMRRELDCLVWIGPDG